MAKKKLNKVAAAAIATTLVLGAGAGAGYYLMLKQVRPKQNREEGRRLMLAGEYEKAFEKFGRANHKYATDVEFQGWMYDTINHRTSFDEDRLRTAIRVLETTIAVQPNHVPTLVERLKFTTDGAERGFGADDFETIVARANTVLEAEPKNEIATRALLLGKVMQLFAGGRSPNISDIDALASELRTIADADPTNPDAFNYYSVVMMQRREAMVRDQAILQGPDTPVAKETLADVEARRTAILAAADVESGEAALPAERRARIYRAASQIDGVLLNNRFLPRERLPEVRERRFNGVLAAARAMPSDALLYPIVRREAAQELERLNRFDEAEKTLRDTVAQRPDLWSPLLDLAEYLSRRERDAEAVTTLSADLKPSEKLVGLEGFVFLMDSRTVPIRRSLFRLNALDRWRGTDAATRPSREAEIAKAKADYDLALALKPSESDPRVLHAQSAIQEAEGDRSAAAETLRKAVDAAATGGSGIGLETLRPMMLHLVDLNMDINQPGRAADVLSRLVEISPTTNDVIRLLDMRIRNNQVDKANEIVARLRQVMPDNPVIPLAEAKLASTPAAMRAALEKVPEDAPGMAYAKFMTAFRGGNRDLAREIATRALAATPNDALLAAGYVDMLLGENKKDEAMRVVDAALAKEPGSVALQTIKQTLGAANPDEAFIATLPPYDRAIAEANQLRVKGDIEGFIARQREAITLDKDKDGRAAQGLFLFLLAVNRADEAEPLLETMGKSRLDPAMIRAHRGRLAVARGQADEALTLGNRLVNDLPEFAPGWIVKGEAHHLKQQWDQAAAAFDTALNAKPNDVEALRGAIEAAERLGQRDKLRQLIDAGLRVAAQDPFFSDRSLRWETMYGDPVKTIEPRKASRDAAPDQPGTWLGLAQAYTQASRARAAAADTAGAEQYRKLAYDTLNEATAKFPKAAGFPLQAAELAMQGGDRESAVKLLDAMEQTPEFRDDPQVQYARSEYYLMLGNVEKSRPILDGLIASGKGGEPAILRLSNVQAAAGDIDGAIRTLDGAPTKTDAVSQAKFNLLLQSNRPADATAMAESLVAAQRSVPNLLMAALAKAASQDLPGALKLVDEAIAQAPEDGSARFTRARLLLGERPVRSNLVIEDLEAVRKVSPNNVDARMMLSDRYTVVGRASEAMAELDNAQRAQPGNLAIVTKLIGALLAERPPRYSRIDDVVASAKKAGLSTDTTLLTLESQVAMQQGDAERAIRVAAEAVKNGGDNTELYRNFLNALIRGKKYNDALTELDRIQAQNGALYWTYMLRGLALHQLKREPEAAAQWDRAVSVATSLRDNASSLTEIASTYAGEYGSDAAAEWLKAKLPGNAEAQALAVTLYYREGKHQKAIDAGIAMMPGFDGLTRGRQITALNHYGSASLAITPPDAARARDAFERLLKLDPENILTLNNLAYTLTLEGSGGTIEQARDAAKQAFDLSVRSGVEDAYIMDTYGWTLIQAGDVGTGLDILRRAQSVKRLPEIEFHIGVGLTKSKDKGGAIQSLQNALAMLDELSKNGQAVDGSLKTRILEALEEAQRLEG